MTVVLRWISAPRVAGALGERLGEIGGLDIAVVGMLDGADDAIGLAQRPDLLDLAGVSTLTLTPIVSATPA